MFRNYKRDKELHSRTIRLSSVKSGNVVKIQYFTGGEGLKTRLLELGIIPDSTVRVINSSSKGPLLLQVSDSRIMLGHGMAEKIYVIC